MGEQNSITKNGISNSNSKTKKSTLAKLTLADFYMDYDFVQVRGLIKLKILGVKNLRVLTDDLLLFYQDWQVQGFATNLHGDLVIKLFKNERNII